MFWDDSFAVAAFLNRIAWHFACYRSPITVQLSSLKCKEMPSSEQQQNKDQNGNFSVESEEERINRNMAKFLSMEKQQQQLVLCLRQQQMPKSLLQMGALRKTTVACNFFLHLMSRFCAFKKGYFKYCRWPWKLFGSRWGYDWAGP